MGRIQDAKRLALQEPTSLVWGMHIEELQDHPQEPEYTTDNFRCQLSTVITTFQAIHEDINAGKYQPALAIKILDSHRDQALSVCVKNRKKTDKVLTSLGKSGSILHLPTVLASHIVIPRILLPELHHEPNTEDDGPAGPPKYWEQKWRDCSSTGKRPLTLSLPSLPQPTRSGHHRSPLTCSELLL